MYLSKNSWDEFSQNFNFDKYYKNELLNIIISPQQQVRPTRRSPKRTIFGWTWNKSKNLRVVNITTYKNEWGKVRSKKFHWFFVTTNVPNKFQLKIPYPWKFTFLYPTRTSDFSVKKLHISRTSLVMIFQRRDSSV